MPRILYLLLGVVLATLPLVDASIRLHEPSPSDLTLARGGDPGQGKGSVYCDEESGIYLGCTKIGDTCRLCLTAEDDGSLSSNKADMLQPMPPNGTPGYTNGQSAQDCGDYFIGTCVADAEEPSGFTCECKDSMNTCTQGIMQVVPQSTPITITPGPWTP